jgi:GAF domain-containing protein
MVGASLLSGERTHEGCPPHPQEEARLAALDTLEILDTLPEAGFDELTRLASQLCGTPIALVSLVDNYRQWFKSRVGLDAPETPRELAFCAHAILGEQLFVVEDAHNDERFHDNPLVTGGPHVRFYAGVPIKGASGLNMGTLCVIDHQPRHLTPEQERALAVLGHQVEAQLLLRLRVRDEGPAIPPAARAHLLDAHLPDAHTPGSGRGLLHPPARAPPRAPLLHLMRARCRPGTPRAAPGCAAWRPGPPSPSAAPRPAPPSTRPARPSGSAPRGTPASGR